MRLVFDKRPWYENLSSLWEKYLTQAIENTIDFNQNYRRAANIDLDRDRSASCEYERDSRSPLQIVIERFQSLAHVSLESESVRLLHKSLGHLVASTYNDGKRKRDQIHRRAQCEANESEWSHDKVGNHCLFTCKCGCWKYQSKDNNCNGQLTHHRRAPLC